MGNAIAFFDFDGTITKKDTLLEFVKYSKGTVACYTGFLLNLHYLLAYKLKIITNQKAKEKILTYFFKHMLLSTFDELCNRFAAEKIPGLVRPAANDEIKQLQQKKMQIVIVSASPENWIQQWATKTNAVLIATKLQVKDNRLTGKIDGLNCNGPEKVRRIKEKYNLELFDEIYAYGDTNGDKPMLAIAQHSKMKPFR
jgi:phosphatidylglycerophosphatase C